jgi:spore coat protein U-like protein
MRRIVRTFQSSAKSALRPAWRVVPLVVMGLMAASGVQAASPQSATFDVTVNLTPACTVTPAGNITLNYLSFGPVVSGALTTVAIKCTSSLPYSVALDLGSGGNAITPLVYSYTDSVVQLNYALSLSSVSLSPMAAGTGNGSAQTVTVTASMAGNQGGICANSAAVGCSNALNAAKTRTLTVSY